MRIPDIFLHDQPKQPREDKRPSTGILVTLVSHVASSPTSLKVVVQRSVPAAPRQTRETRTAKKKAFD